jgi:hypothetical protein
VFALALRVMRGCLLAAHVFLMASVSTVGLAQQFDSRVILSPSKDGREVVDSRARTAESPAADGSASPRREARHVDREPFGRANAETTSTAGDSLQRLVERLRPLQDRFREDHRMRRAESILGLGIVAYQALGNRREIPLSFVGTHALRLGLHRELADIRERSGYVVEPSIGHRSFVITFRRTLD